jgi:hypothetical protein
MRVGAGFEGGRGLVRNVTQHRLIRTVADEAPRQRRKGDRHRRGAADAETRARTISFTVQRDLGGGRHNGEIAVTAADLGEGRSGLLVAPDVPIDARTFIEPAIAEAGWVRNWIGPKMTSSVPVLPSGHTPIPEIWKRSLIAILGLGFSFAAALFSTVTRETGNIGATAVLASACSATP